jgi:ubiquinone/menaquinone biosynthesis C-methylase UbiE
MSIVSLLWLLSHVVFKAGSPMAYVYPPECMMIKTHEKAVEAQFGSRAKAYVDSAVHSQGADLDALESIVRNSAPARALDLGTGGGHVAYLMARQAQKVVAVDLSNEMTAAVARTASERGLGNIETVAAPVENLPFENGSFDFLACRYSAHHWRDFDGGLREASRVLKRGLTAVFIDVYSPGPALFDTHLQAIELLRDTSHVRDYTMSEWIAALARSGFAPVRCQTWKLRMDFPTWTARMGTPDENARAIRALQAAASAEVEAQFAIEDDGSFMLDILMIEARNS